MGSRVVGNQIVAGKALAIMHALITDEKVFFTIQSLHTLEAAVRQRRIVEQDRVARQERHEARALLGQIGDPPQDRPADSDT